MAATPELHIYLDLNRGAWVIPSYADPDLSGLTEGTARPTHCSACNAPILFVITREQRRRAPLDADGKSHFSSCPSADKFRKKR